MRTNSIGRFIQSRHDLKNKILYNSELYITIDLFAKRTQLLGCNIRFSAEGLS